ncbi:MAG: hypothetical protein JWP00_4018 [Chloroflexi bacterium]|nr:hypothetical protein [Chloroflexota bacterium]
MGSGWAVRGVVAAGVEVPAVVAIAVVNARSAVPETVSEDDWEGVVPGVVITLSGAAWVKTAPAGLLSRGASGVGVCTEEFFEFVNAGRAVPEIERKEANKRTTTSKPTGLLNHLDANKLPRFQI